MQHHHHHHGHDTEVPVEPGYPRAQARRPQRGGVPGQILGFPLTHYSDAGVGTHAPARFRLHAAGDPREPVDPCRLRDSRVPVWREAFHPGRHPRAARPVTVAFAFSVAVTLGYPGMPLWEELATLVTIMLLGHWLEMRSIMQAQGALAELAKLLLLRSLETWRLWHANSGLEESFRPTLA